MTETLLTLARQADPEWAKLNAELTRLRAENAEYRALLMDYADRTSANPDQFEGGTIYHIPVSGRLIRQTRAVLAKEAK